MELDVNSFLTYLSRGGILGLLALIIVSGMKQVWVWGWMYRQAVADRDEWKTRWLKAAELAEQAVRNS